MAKQGKVVKMYKQVDQQHRCCTATKIEIQRRKGYGTKMMQNAMLYCVNNNILFIMLISKKNDIFFKKLGFSKDILIQLDNKNYEIITMMKSM